ncbi:MAG: Rieske 2Fe-2S domain-containing protein [Thermodesulfobacteriota bacterium]
MSAHDQDRRSFLKGSFGIVLAAASGSFLWAAGKFFSKGAIALPSRPGHSGAFDQGSASEGRTGIMPKRNPDGTYEVSQDAVPDGGYAIAAIAGAPLILVRNGDTVRTFNATCSHLGCLVKRDPSGNGFLCPCHGGRYDADGRVVSGPPPAALQEHRTTCADGKVTIAVA